MLLSERPGVTDVQSVYTLQGLYLQCLYVYMKYTRPGVSIVHLIVFVNGYSKHAHAADQPLYV